MIFNEVLGEKSPLTTLGKILVSPAILYLTFLLLITWPFAGFVSKFVIKKGRKL